jgi:hypothetical protein
LLVDVQIVIMSLVGVVQELGIDVPLIEAPRPTWYSTGNTTSFAMMIMDGRLKALQFLTNLLFRWSLDELKS